MPSLETEPQQSLLALAQSLREWHPTLPEGRFAGRGIVIVAGGASVFTNAYVLVSVLRGTLQCKLPIEVWHFGPEEISPAMAALLAEFDVALIDAQPIIAAHDARIRDGWQLKPFALQWSSFAEVLLLDADQVPITDPASVFDWPEFRSAGAVFWPDTHELLPGNPVWAELGLPPRQTIAFESGQVLVDKRRHWRALSVTVRLNEEAERLYRLIYGDKDTFLVGWELAGAEFALVPHRAFMDERCFFQRDFAGNPLFQHRTNCKWSYAGEQFVIDGFQHLDVCLEALDRLRARWNGRVFHAPDRTSRARRAEAELAASSPHRFEIDMDEKFVIELWPHGEIGRGRSHDRPNWWCEEEGDALDLVLGDNRAVQYRLRRVTEDRWEGRRLRPPATLAGMTTSQLEASRAADAPGMADELLRAAGFPRSLSRDRDRLDAALRLLARVDPGIGERLARLAATEPDPALAAELRSLARAADPGPPLQQTVREPSVMRRGYRASADDAAE